MLHTSYPYKENLDPKELILGRLADPEPLLTALGVPYRRRPAGKCLIACVRERCGCANTAVRFAPDRGVLMFRCPACGEAGNAFHLVAWVNHLDVRRDFRRVMAIAARIGGLDPDVVLGTRRTIVEKPRREDLVDFDAVFSAIERPPAPKVPRVVPVATPVATPVDDLAALLAAIERPPAPKVRRAVPVDHGCGDEVAAVLAALDGSWAA